MAKVVEPSCEPSCRSRLGSLEIKNLEKKTLNRCIEALTEHLHIDQVLDKLLEEELINGEQHGVIGKLIEDKKRKQAVRIAIEQLQLNPPGFLKTFCDILKGDKKTEWLVEEITKEHKALSDAASSEDTDGTMKQHDATSEQATLNQGIDSSMKQQGISWKPFDMATAHRLLRPLDADWEELAAYLLKDRIDERIKSINANCSVKFGDKGLIESIKKWLPRTTRDKRTWKTLCEAAEEWEDLTLEQYMKDNKLKCDQEPTLPHVMKWGKQSSLRTDWYGFAVKILDNNEADAIKRNLGGGGNKECLEMLLVIWYNSTISHSWQMIVNALNEMSAAEKVLERIKEECTV